MENTLPSINMRNLDKRSEKRKHKNKTKKLAIVKQFF